MNNLNNEMRAPGTPTTENLEKARQANPAELSKTNLISSSPEPNSNSILFDSLSKSYNKLNKIYKEFNKVYIPAPSSNSGKKAKYDKLQTLQTDFDNEYKRIRKSLTYSGNDKGVRNLITDITKLRGELLLRTRSITRHDIGLTYTMGNAYNQFIKKYDTLKELIDTNPNPTTNVEPIKTYYETNIEPIKRTFESEFNRLDPKGVSPDVYRSVQEKKADINRRVRELFDKITLIQSAPAPASAAVPDPVSASPPAPPQIPLSRRNRIIPMNPFANTALKPNAQPPSTNRRTVLISTRKNNNTAIRITNAPEEQPAPPLSSNLQNNTNLENARTRAQNLIDKSLLGKQPTISKMYTNTRKKSNKNALKNHSLASLYPNMNSFEEQSASVNAPQPNNSNRITAGASNTLANNNPVLYPTSSTQSNENLFRNIHTTANELKRVASGKPQTPQQPVQYIKLVNGTTYKFIEITDDNKAKVQKLDRVTKTWGPIEDLSDEQVVGFTEVNCPPSQAGGRRTCRRRPQKKHKKTRRQGWAK